MVRRPSVLGALLALTASASLASNGEPPHSASTDAAQAVVTKTCAACHNDRTRTANLSFQSFDVATAGHDRALLEKMIRKVRTGQMPPPGARRPDEAALAGLA